MSFRTLDDVDVSGKRVLLRVDFNVPMQDGEVTDPTRIERAAATVRELSGKGGKVIILSHFGRPKGEAVSSMSLRPIAKALGRVLAGRAVAFADDCVGEAASAVIDDMRDGDIAVLENLRFHAGEEKFNADFAGQLASLGDIYVNDAFSCSHRSHASITGLASRLPAFAGRLMQAELEALGTALGGSKRPAAALIGGAKVSSKLDVLGQILDRIDLLIIGGGMANTFLAARGIHIGKSLCEYDLAQTARDIMAKAEGAGVEIVLPVDAVVAKEFKEHADCREIAIGQVEADDMILDIGSASAAAIEAKLEQAKTLLWNGPMGAFEIVPFDEGTNAVARAAAKLTQRGGLTTVAGGGDTVAALAHAGVVEQFSYVSTAGGAFLEWLEGKTLPGGCRAVLSVSPPVVVVHSRPQAVGVRAICPNVELIVPPHVSSAGGPLFVRHLIEGLHPPPWVDCHDNRGLTLGMIRTGIGRMIFRGPTDVRQKLADMAASRGQRVSGPLASPVWELLPGEVGARVLGVRLKEAGILN